MKTADVQMLELTTLEAKRFLTPALLERDVSFGLMGPPGIGKSAIAHQIADDIRAKLGADFGGLIVEQPVFKEATDTRLPYLLPDKPGQFNWASPGWLPNPDDPRLWLFLVEELPQADASMQKFLSPLLWEKRYGDVPLPRRTRVIATGNRLSDRAGANRVFTHTRDRFCALYLKADLEIWINWAHANNVDPMVIAYLRYQPDSLFQFDPNSLDRPTTPRSWAMLAQLLRLTPADTLLNVAAGCLGIGVGRAFCEFFRRETELPELADVLANPKKAKLPDDPCLMWLLIGALAGRMKTEKKHFTPYAQYVLRMSDEYQVKAFKDFLGSNKGFIEGIKGTPELAAFTRGNLDAFTNMNEF